MILPFVLSSGLIVVPAYVHGPGGVLIARLAIDTRATISTLESRLLSRVGYDPAVIEETVRLHTASGTESVPLISVGKLEAMAQVRTGFPVLCHTFPDPTTVDGVLGLDFFRGTRLTLDFRIGLITLD